MCVLARDGGGCDLKPENSCRLVEALAGRRFGDHVVEHRLLLDLRRPNYRRPKRRRFHRRQHGAIRVTPPFEGAFEVALDLSPSRRADMPPMSLAGGGSYRVRARTPEDLEEAGTNTPACEFSPFCVFFGVSFCVLSSLKNITRVVVTPGTSLAHTGRGTCAIG